MKSTVETVEPTRAKLTVEVDYDELKPHMDAAYKDIAGQVEIPGFRKGKVPPRIIDQRFGRGAVIEQVVNESLPGYYGDALQENELRPMAQPQIDVVEVPATEGEPGGVLKFTAEVDVVPAFELPSLEDITVEVEATEVSDEAIQEELDQLRGRFATLKTLERPAEDGDYLSLDLSVDVNGKNIDSLSDVSYELGSGTMLDGMDEALRGKSAGDEVVFVAPIKGGEYAGEDGDVTAKVLSVKERELPEVDEDFVQMVSEFDTIEELTEDLKKQVATRTKSDQALAARNALLEKLIAETEILLPEAPVAAEVDERVDENTTDEERKELREKIEGEIRQQIFLDTLAAKQEVKIAQQELIDFMLHTSQTFGIDPNQLFSDQNQIQGMMGELARTKALVSVLRNTKVVDTNGEEVDISEFTRDPAEDVEVVTDPEGE
ncbi:trigger factor [Actinomycetaceae bacterium WB03_NA08]|uniref:Trigger factor n=1 Tax=Scrofimicrobium canadense TaxID=2652290 RepID=A0A6N7W8U4_9ACTO|nr:trigger factor [Scrofimicrobium canadense]MSS84568.1 trigger factor [Scrofimicrobium canadense]